MKKDKLQFSANPKYSISYSDSVKSTMGRLKHNQPLKHGFQNLLNHMGVSMHFSISFYSLQSLH